MYLSLGVCHDGGITVNDTCYFAYDAKGTWFDLNNFCQSQGGIPGQSGLESHMIRNGLGLTAGKQYWTGITRRRWLWAHGKCHCHKYIYVMVIC